MNVSTSAPWLDGRLDLQSSFTSRMTNKHTLLMTGSYSHCSEKTHTKSPVYFTLIMLTERLCNFNLTAFFCDLTLRGMFFFKKGN